MVGATGLYKKAQAKAEFPFFHSGTFQVSLIFFVKTIVTVKDSGTAKGGGTRESGPPCDLVE